MPVRLLPNRSLGTLAFLLLTRLVAVGAQFDACVDKLYGYGGLSKAVARQECARDPSDSTINCQNKKFLLQFLAPQDSMDSCRDSKNVGPIAKEQLYRGHFESVPPQDRLKTVCTVTVNSTDERSVFRKLLDPGEYHFVELLPKDVTTNERFVPRDSHWLKRACEQKIKCDILVVSGHFASTFMGSTGYEIKLEDLTKASCGSDCEGFFENIKQVFLFGCNTLVTKTADSRSLSQYRTILVEDGVSPHEAQRIAARRYTPYGETIQEEIRKLFPNANMIFGFAGPGPTGASVRPTLEKFARTSFSKNISTAEFNENFQATLGRKGMFGLSGKAKDQYSCLEKPRRSSQALAGYSALSAFVEKYALGVPVAAFDLILESLEVGAINLTDTNALHRQIFAKFEAINSNMRRKILCPLLLTDHAAALPASLSCREPLNWL